jgi:tetratricopeptide (TPR) repeat protein
MNTRWGYAMAATLLLAWGVGKLGWEHHLQVAQQQSRSGGFILSKGLSAEIGQGASIALLAGMRSLVANYWWIRLSNAWERQEWFRVKSLIELVTTLQPRSTLFWEMGGWHLAWNASAQARHDLDEPSEVRRIRNERYWIEQGRQVFQRGLENIPEKYNLWFQLGWLHDQKLRDYLKAAEYYREAIKRSGAPSYLERFVGYNLQKGGDDVGAYAWWRQLWFSSAERTDRRRGWDIIEKRLRQLEDKLAIPAEKRVFPSPPVRLHDRK